MASFHLFPHCFSVLDVNKRFLVRILSQALYRYSTELQKNGNYSPLDLLRQIFFKGILVPTKGLMSSFLSFSLLTAIFFLVQTKMLDNHELSVQVNLFTHKRMFLRMVKEACQMDEEDVIIRMFLLEMTYYLFLLLVRRGYKPTVSNGLNCKVNSLFEKSFYIF